MCFYRRHHEEFKDFFSQEDGVMFCNDVCSIMEVLGRDYKPDQWHLFIDLSKVSLKVVLLHNGNRFPSVPLDHAANMKESFESMQLLLGKIKYEGRLISNAHSEISRKRDHVFKQTKVGCKVQYFSYKLTYLFFDIVALLFNTFFPT